MSPNLLHKAPTPDHLPSADHLDVPVRQIMTPGVVSIVEDATLSHVHRAMAAHGVHAVLVVGRSTAAPLGWVTTRGLLAWMDEDITLAAARDAVTNKPMTIEPGASAREAVTALSQPGVSHLLVTNQPNWFPEGVVGEMDLVVLTAR